MPSIAVGARQSQAKFYWHLGDARFIRDFDQDYRQLHPDATIQTYLANAWIDFQQNQIAAFGDMPFFLGIGNHETIAPKTRQEFIVTFADWLDAPPIREQRLKDDPQDHAVRTYYHWLRDGVDFVYLDNATLEQFEASQMLWLRGLLNRDKQDAGIRALVVGMHETLPKSLVAVHSMDDELIEEATGREAYAQLLTVNAVKPVYVLASHTHFVMEGIFDTAYWREHGGVLRGWIVGTAGAVRYPLPATAEQAKFARTRVYGFLLATVMPRGVNDRDPIHFQFNEVTESDVPRPVIDRFGSEFIHRCYAENVQP
jgi:hypothetical protein